MSEVAVIEPEKVEDKSLITLDQIKRVLPRGSSHQLGQRVVDNINALTHGKNRDLYRENVLGYASAMKDGSFKIGDYINAVKYVTHKLMGDPNIEAYVKTFPERYQYMLDKNYQQKHIESRVAIYNKNILVSKVFEQTLIPTHIVNADIHQKAINHLAFLMINAKSEKVQSDSAAKLVDALKMPETTKIELDVGMKEDKSIKELHATMLELAALQKRGIELGTHTVKEVAHSKLLIDMVEDAEVIE